jgi:GST-like protein
LTHPATGLFPADVILRAEAVRGLFYIAANCYSAIGIIDYPERWLVEKNEAARENIRAGVVQRLHANWGIFTAMFPGAGFFGGSCFIMVGTRDYLRDSHPDLLALLERVELHATVAPIYGRHWPT